MKHLQEFTTGGKLQKDSSSHIKAIEKLPLPYSGNKKRLLCKIHKAINQNDLRFNSVLDAFSGSSSISLLFKIMGKKVISNDFLTSAYMTSVAYVENENINLTEKEKKFLLSKNINKNKNTFVEDNYLSKAERPPNKKCRFNKFTLNECIRIDSFRANINDLLGRHNIHDYFIECPFVPTESMINSFLDKSTYSIVHSSTKHDMRIKQALFFANLQQHILRDCMVGGRMYNGQSIAETENRLKHQKNQIKSNWDNNCVPEMQFLTNTGLPGQGMKWRHFTDAQMSGRGLSINCGSIDLLQSGMCDKVDCVYFDPPYGGPTSDYASIYRFLEEYIYSKPLEDLSHIQNSCNKFTKSVNYKKYFLEMLEASKKIPLWIFSYNDKSWKSIDYICKLIKKFDRTIKVEILDEDYRYLYRKNQGRKNKSIEYLIIAH